MASKKSVPVSSSPLSAARPASSTASEEPGADFDLTFIQQFLREARRISYPQQVHKDSKLLAQARVASNERKQALVLLVLDHSCERQRTHPLTGDPLAQHVDEVDRDHALGQLLQGVLKALPVCTPDFATALMERLIALQPRLTAELVKCHYGWGFAHAVGWLDGLVRTQPSVLAAAREPARQWLDRFSLLVLANAERAEAWQDAEDAKPLDPAGFSYDILLQAREDRARHFTPEARAAVRERLADYPEQSLASEDRDAVLLLRQWGRLRDDGSLPLEPESDDWGRQISAALAGLPRAERDALEVCFVWLRDHPPASKPTARWAAAWAQQRQQLERTVHPTRLQAWSLDLLSAFRQTDGQTQWATSGARPGWGAVPGPEGLVVAKALLSWLSAEGGDGARAQAVLQDVATAAFRHLDQVGFRSPAIGKQAMQRLAETPSGHAWVVAFGRTNRKPAFKKAVDEALQGKSPPGAA